MDTFAPHTPLSYIYRKLTWLESHVFIYKKMNTLISIGMGWVGRGACWEGRRLVFNKLTEVNAWDELDEQQSSTESRI